MSSDQKYVAELAFWREEIGRYVRWYKGRVREMYGVPAPLPRDKIVRHATIEQNAIETWINADKWRYCKHLCVEPTYFDGKLVLEVGCGPLGLSRWFAGARVYGLDPLIDQYLAMGYPKWPGTPLQCNAEEILANAGVFDAIISVNAIDHVDDFEQTVKELARVLKPGGEIRIEVHYHDKTITEPIVLDDMRVAAAFEAAGVSDMRKISELPSVVFYPPGTHPKTDRFALWSNKQHLFDAVHSLK